MAEREDDIANGGTGVRIRDRTRDRAKPPRQFRVVLLNDDFTPIDWVVALIQQVFRKSVEEAIAITLQVHNEGIGIAGVYTYEIAETKCAQARNLARRAEHPLMVEMEPAE